MPRMLKVNLRSRLSLAFVAACAGASGVASAQTRPAAGLAAVGDELLLQELSRYGMDDLIQRYAQTAPLSAEREASVRAMLAMRTLTAGNARLLAGQRQQLVRDIVRGADAMLPTINDPRQLARLGNALIASGMERSANAMEYWGENPTSQLEIRPVAELVARVLDRAGTLARRQADALAADFGATPSAAQQKQYAELDALAANSRYTRLMADYYRAIAYDRADPAREKIASEAMAALREFDNPESRVQPIVRLRLAKLQMAAGRYGDATTGFVALAENADAAISPPPTLAQQFEARYFACVCAILARDTVTSERRFTELTGWAKKSLAEQAAMREAADTSVAILQYRLLSLKAELAADPESGHALERQGTGVLRQLAASHPELRGVIFEQLARSLPSDTPLQTLDPLMLKALVQQGVAEQLKPAAETRNRNRLLRAVAACRELLGRHGQGAAEPELRDGVGVILPQLLEAVGNDLEAIDAYVQYAQATTNRENGVAAVRNALAAVGRVRVAHPGSADLGTALDQLLEVAVTRYGRIDLAYEWGQRLQAQGQLAEAAAAYARVPASDARYFAARFQDLWTRKGCFEQESPRLDLAERAKRRLALDHMAASVSETLAAATRSAGASEQGPLVDLQARTLLLWSELVIESDPKRVIAILGAFPAGSSLGSDRLLLSVRARMALGQDADAAADLLEYVKGQGGDQGAAMIITLLNRLDAELEQAKAANDSARIKRQLEARASLSGPLVNWAQSSREPDVRRHLYQYRVFDAAAQMQAALAEGEPRQRTQRLQACLKRYDALLDGENLALWRESVDATKVDVRYGDVAVLFAKAQVLFELGEYGQAAERLGRLLEDRKLGSPRTATERDGAMVSEDNPVYWEATYKLYRSNMELARQEGAAGSTLLENTRNGLKRLYIREGNAVGGTRWRESFEGLRRELIPGFAAAESELN